MSRGFGGGRTFGAGGIGTHFNSGFRGTGFGHPGFRSSSVRFGLGFGFGAGYGSYPWFYGYGYPYYYSGYPYSYDYPYSVGPIAAEPYAYPYYEPAPPPMQQYYGPAPEQPRVYRPQAPQSVPQGSPSEYREQIYLIAFQDHRIQAAIAYWVDGATLHYVTREHEQKQVPLGQIDRTFSEQLNHDRRVDFRLPR